MHACVHSLLPAAILAALALGCGDAGTGPGAGGPEEPDRPDPPPVQLFIAVHHEPGPDPSATGYAQLHWPALAQLVAAADAQGQKLTLLMNPQWSRFILDDPARLAQVRAWDAGGHEVGLHSHGPSQGSWNGYTNKAAFRQDPRYLGSIDSMMALARRVPASGTVNAASVTDADSGDDYPGGILYDVDGGGGGVADLVSTPTQVQWNGHTMTGLKHARYAATPGGPNLSIAQIGDAIDGYRSGQVFGMVFHVFEFHDAPGPFEDLFTFLKGKSVSARSVSAILSSPSGAGGSTDGGG